MFSMFGLIDVSNLNSFLSLNLEKTIFSEDREKLISNGNPFIFGDKISKMIHTQCGDLCCTRILGVYVPLDNGFEGELGWESLLLASFHYGSNDVKKACKDSFRKTFKDILDSNQLESHIELLYKSYPSRLEQDPFEFLYSMAQYKNYLRQKRSDIKYFDLFQ